MIPLLLSLLLPASAEPGAHAPHASNEKFTADTLDVDAWTARFESAEREVFAQRQAIVDALSLKPGMAVADIGAGTGALLEPLVAAVGPTGTVFATELSAGFREHLAERAEDAGWSSVKVVASTPDASGLKPGSVDVALLVDVWHHLESPEPYLADLARAVKVGGHLVIVDFDPGAEDASDWVKQHVHQSAEEVAATITASPSFDAAPTPDIALKQNRMQVFRRVADAP
jgi:ubiquinone/menaquinone biosynthesis C-methylase UbiE